MGDGDRVGFYVMTFTGRRWWPHDPRPEDVFVGDLAALAQINRFGGATSYRWPDWRVGEFAPYPVAQHSCLVYELVTEWGGSVQERRDALLHDGHEIYPPGDQLSPVLRHACPASEALKEMSRKAATAFRTVLRLSQTMPEIVKRADATMLATEKRDLMPFVDEMWGDNGRSLPPPRERRIEVWSPVLAHAGLVRRMQAVAPDLLTPDLLAALS